MKVPTETLVVVMSYMVATSEAVVDHGGLDLVAVDGQVLDGAHTNIKQFSVPRTVTAIVHNKLVIEAAEAIVKGTFDGTGMGEAGGAILS